MIHKDMKIRDVIEKYPETIRVFKNYGLECAGCSAALFENIEEGASIFGINIEALLDALNKVVKVNSMKSSF